MITQFDPAKAIKEELEGMAAVMHAVGAARRDAEHRLGLAESQVHAYGKIEGWLKIRREELFKRLKELENKGTA